MVGVEEAIHTGWALATWAPCLECGPAVTSQLRAQGLWKTAEGFLHPTRSWVLERGPTPLPRPAKPVEHIRALHLTRGTPSQAWQPPLPQAAQERAPRGSRGPPFWAGPRWGEARREAGPGQAVCGRRAERPCRAVPAACSGPVPNAGTGGGRSGSKARGAGQRQPLAGTESPTWPSTGESCFPLLHALSPQRHRRLRAAEV